MSYYSQEAEATAVLQHLEKDQLQDLLNDSTSIRLDNFIRDLHQVKQAENERETLIISNKSLAEYNLSLRPQLINLKGDVAQRYEELRKLKDSVIEKKCKLDAKSGAQNLDSFLALLQAGSAEAEEASEELADNFLKQNMSVDAYIDNYIRQRTIAHLKKVKAEKMAELIRQGAANHFDRQSPVSNWPPYPHQPPSGNALRNPAPFGSTPYPTGIIYSMPQPQPTFRY